MKKKTRGTLGEKFHNTGFGNDFLAITPKVLAVKKIDFIKIKNFCASKDTINRVKGQPTEGEKILGNHMSDKWLISRIYKELLQQLNTKKTT